MRSVRSALLFLLGLLVALAGTVVPASTGVAAGATATISGQMLVTGGAPIAGAEVTLYASDGWEFYPVDVAETDATGTYRFSAVEPDTYRLGFMDTTGDHVTEYWSNWGTLEQADDIVVPAGADLTDRTVVVTRAGHVTGLVTGDAGAPLPGVKVQAYHYAYAPGGWEWKPVAEAMTVTDGAYDLGSISSGTSRLGFVDNGEVYLPEFWDDALSVEAAQDVTVREGETTVGKDAQLARGGEITGTVSGAEGALADATVTAYAFDAAEDQWAWVTSSATGEDGGYVITGLPADSYRLGFDDDVAGHLTEFWDDAPTIQDATAISVTAGEAVAGLDAELTLGAEITGTVSGPAPVDWVWVSAYEKVAGQWEFAGGNYADEDGTYSVRGLAGGTYRLGFEDDWGPLVREFWNDKTSLDLADDITVAPGGTAGGRDAVLASTRTPVPTPTPPPVPPATPTPVPLPPAAPGVGAQLTAVAKGLKVKGKPVVGKKIKVTSTATDLPVRVAYSFQWYAGARKIRKATRSSLKVTRALKGKVVKVKVKLSADGARKVVTLKVGKVR